MPAVLMFALLAAALPAPAEEPRLLGPGETVERVLSAGEIHRYAVETAAGDLVRLSLAQKGADVAVVVRGPGGAAVLEANLADFRMARESISLVAAAGGRHVVEVRSADENFPGGSYALTCVERRPAAERDEDRRRAERRHMEGKELQRRSEEKAARAALAAFTEAQALWRQVGERDMEAAAKVELARTHMGLGDFAQAGELLRAAGGEWRALGERHQEARALHLLGEVHYHRSEYPAAVEHLERALEARRALGDRWGEAETLGDIASVVTATGDTDRALEAARAALAIWRDLDNAPGKETALSVVGYVHFQRAEWQEALDAFTETLPLKRAHSDVEGEAATLSNIGGVYSRLGEPSAAVTHYEQALALMRRLGNRKGEGAALNNLGTAQDDLGRKADAAETYRQALVLRRAVGDRQGEATTLVNIGVLALEAGRFQEAREPFEQALRILEEVGGRGNQANALGYLGRIAAASGDPGQARAKLEQALALKRQVSDQAGEATMLYHLARLARDQGDLSEAHRWAEEAVGRVESMRTGLRSAALRASYTASVREIYELYIDVLTRLHEREPGTGRDVESLRASERARARALLDLLLESRADIREGADPALRERERTLHDRLTLKLDRQLRLLSRAHTPEQAEAAAREIDALTAEYDDVRARLRRASPHYAALTQPAPPDLADIQRRLLDADTILLEYALGRERSTLWAVTDETFSLFTLPAGARIEETARKAAELLALRDPGPAAEKERRAALGALSEMLLAPAAAALGNRRVVIVPDGALYYVPFAALPDPRSPARPLLARHEVIALPSAAVLSVLREELGHRRPAPKTLAVLADPVFDARDERLAGGGPPARARATPPVERGVDRAARAAGLEGGLPRLPFTRREAQAILALVPRDARKEALDFDASRATATAPDLGEYRFVHFATHGFLNASRPELSGIVLSLVDRRGRDQNGFLSAPEVFNLRLGADMVVLSGCRTGLGREVRGEGLVGLTRAFMYAGTPRVLASLWKVDDAATAELMTRLYRGLLERRLSPSAALREAQLALAGTRRWRSPYFWASFQMHGDWKGPDR